MTTPTADRSVRPARPADAPAVGGVQARAWADAYAGLVPADTLAQLSAEVMAAQWSASISAPPSTRHHVLVALAGDRVVGFAAMGPSSDPDLDADVDAELVALVVDADAGRDGHGARLLQAVVDTLRGDRFGRAHLWASEADAVLAGYLEGAGWGPDGAVRTLDLEGDGAVLVAQRRLHTDLGT